MLHGLFIVAARLRGASKTIETDGVTILAILRLSCEYVAYVGLLQRSNKWPPNQRGDHLGTYLM